MGRQTRQARRAQERRAQARGRQSSQGPDRKWVLAGIAVVVAAIALFGILYATQGTTSSASPTPVPAAAVNGVGCNPGGEVVTYHEHAHLTLLNHGKQVNVPDLIGYNVDHDCLFWLHTHTGEEGVIHMEAPSKITPQLITFFKIWGVPLTATQIGPIKVSPGEEVRTYVNGKRYTGSIADITLQRHLQIVVEVGQPFVKPPTFAFGTL